MNWNAMKKKAKASWRMNGRALNSAAGSWNRDVAGDVWKKAPRTMASTIRTASQRTTRPTR